MSNDVPNSQHPSRRKFIKTAGAAAIGASAAPAFLYAADKSGRARPRLGKGEFMYEAIHGWGQLPDGFKWVTTHGVIVDEEGLIYIKQLGKANAGTDTILVFDQRGRFVRSFGKEYCGGGHGIDVRKENGEQFLYLCDVFNRQVVKTNLKGEQVWSMQYPPEAGVYQKIEQFKPTNVAFAPDGGFYVGDGYGSHYIHQYDRNAKWVRTWGGKGTEPGKMQTPHGLWLDDRPGREPSLVVADRANARLQYFTLDGKFISFVEDVLFPAHFDIRGDVLLVPDLHARVSLFDRNNKPIVHMGDDAEWIEAVKDRKRGIRADESLWQPGKFVHPHDACFDHEGNIFVVEWVATGRVTKLQKLS